VALTHQGGRGGRNEIFERKVIFAAIFGVDRLRVVTFAMGQAHPHQVDLGAATEAPLVSVQQARP